MKCHPNNNITETYREAYPKAKPNIHKKSQKNHQRTELRGQDGMLR